MTQTRRLAAILAADVAGYSRLIGADEDGTLQAIDSRDAGAIADQAAGRGGFRRLIDCRNGIMCRQRHELCRFETLLVLSAVSARLGLSPWAVMFAPCVAASAFPPM